jgi:6-phosphofructokinase 1
VEYRTIPLGEVARQTKPLPDAYIAESGTDTTREFLEYLEPLVGAMPRYARLAHNHAG